MGQYKIPFSLGNRQEGKKILILEEKKNIETLLHQILRRSSDVFEITHAMDLFECALQLGLQKPNLVILEIGAKTQDIERLLKSMQQFSETRETRVLIFNSLSPGMKKTKSFPLDSYTVIQEPFTIENVRPHLLELLGGAPPAAS
jgi:PleD family two-component response regulator